MPAVVKTSGGPFGSNLRTVSFNAGVTEIPANLFSSSGIFEIIIPSTVTKIGGFAFRGCTNLTSITIPNSVVSIGNYAFCDCSNLSTVIMPSGIQIGNYAFDNTPYGDSLENTTSTVDIFYNSHDIMIAETVETAYLSNAAAAETIDVSRAEFSGLMPEKLYNFYVMADKNAEEPFSSANLLNIQQGTSDSTGALTITYIGDERFDTADIFVVCEEPVNLENAIVSDSAFAYTGEIHYVDPVVTLDGKILDSAEDYYLSGEYCATNAGIHTYYVIGKGIYGGTIEKTYTISAKSISGFTVDAIASQDYTGLAITPDVVIHDGEYTLVQDTDYELSYSNNINPGTATVTITGIGNYTGTKTTTFEILAKIEITEIDKPENVATKFANGGVTITWDRVESATSYRVFRADTKTGAKTLLKAVTSTSYTDNARARLITTM